MTEFEIQDLPEQATAVRRAAIPAAELRQFFDETFPMLWGAIEGQDVQAVGPPFAMYHGMPGEVVDLEIGFPVDGAFAPRDELKAGVLPGGRAIVGMHVGPYETLPSTWAAMQEWGAQRGARPSDTFWEVYLSDPGAEPDPNQWRTQLVQPVENGV